MIRKPLKFHVNSAAWQDPPQHVRRWWHRCHGSKAGLTDSVLEAQRFHCKASLQSCASCWGRMPEPAGSLVRPLRNIQGRLSSHQSSSKPPQTIQHSNPGVLMLLDYQDKVFFFFNLGCKLLILILPNSSNHFSSGGDILTLQNSEGHNLRVEDSPLKSNIGSLIKTLFCFYFSYLPLTVLFLFKYWCHSADSGEQHREQTDRKSLTQKLFNFPVGNSLRITSTLGQIAFLVDWSLLGPYPTHLHLGSTWGGGIIDCPMSGLARADGAKW